MSWLCKVFLLFLSLVWVSSAHPNNLKTSLVKSGPPDESESNSVLHFEVELTMEIGELEPSHFPARRAAQVALHYLNTVHGSPFKAFGLHKILKASLKDMSEAGNKYHVEFSVKEMFSSRTVESCSAEVLFPKGEEQKLPEVQISCDGMNQIETNAEEEKFFQHYKSSAEPVNAHHLPDSYGNIAKEMKPFWNLGRVVSSFVMLKESNESTLYNMAQVENVTQLETQDDQLRLQYYIILHEMVSQEMIHWKLLVSWSPAGGVKVLETEFVPKCHHCHTQPTHSVTPTPPTNN
ncbi:latexin [Chanos chanos]|uniref:Latexin n=1 Tax=Chanos chanos TaxID=29144 RepID=A0A6J2VR05_CHACN|nr:latexin [Chanos chanos]